MPLFSLQNSLVKKVRRAIESGRPIASGAMAAEGPHLLGEALRSSWRIEQILCSTAAMDRHQSLLVDASNRGIETIEVADHTFDALSGMEQSQGILSLVRPNAFAWADLLKRQGPVIILDGIQDPGNAGAITRSAEAFGGAGVVFTEGCVRVSNGKFLRAAAGSIFRLPFLESVPRGEIVSQIKSATRRLFSLTANGCESLYAISLIAPFALVVGSEGNGVSQLLRDASASIGIPTEGVESLNAAIACSISLFEAARQRKSMSV